MPEWFVSSFQTEQSLPPVTLAIRLSVGLVMGWVIACIYRFTCIRQKPQSTLMATLVLLTILIGMVTMVIGNSVARAFSLVGALSIVRFRTVVTDTRDTAFVIFAVAVGMAVGAGVFLVPLIGIPITALAAFLFRSQDSEQALPSSEHLLTLRVALSYNPKSLQQLFETHLREWTSRSTATLKQGSALELTWVVSLQNSDGGIAFVTELNRLEGMQEVRLQQH